MGNRHDNSFDFDPDVVDWDEQDRAQYRKDQDERYLPDDTLDEDDEIPEDEDDYEREEDQSVYREYYDYDDDVEEESE